MSFSVTSERTENRRNLKRVLLAIAVVMCMSAFPFAVSSESDAYTNGSDGYVLRIGTEATDYSTFGVFESDFYAGSWMDVFAMTGFWIADLPSEVHFKHHSLTMAVGSAVSGKTLTEFYADEYNNDITSITYKPSGSILSSDFSAMYPDYAKAVTDYFGASSYSDGDTLTVKGTVSGSYSEKEIRNFSDVNSTECVVTSSEEAGSHVVKADLTFIYVPNGGTEKTLTVKLDGKAYIACKYGYDFHKDISSVVDGDPIDVSVSSLDKGFSGSNVVTVNGTEYSLGQYLTDPFAYSNNAYLWPIEDVVHDDTLSSVVDGKSAEHVSYEKGYAAAEKEYNSVFDSAKKGTDFIKYILIAGAVSAIAILAVLAFFVLRKKKA